MKLGVVTRLGVTVALTLAVTACGRSGLDEDQVQQLTTATDNSSTALQNSEDNADAIDVVEDRVDTLEGEGGNAVQDQLTDIEADVTAIEEDLQDLDGRVDMLEGMHPVNDEDLIIDDKVAAGFPDAAPVNNGEQAFSYVNQRIDVADANIVSLGNEIDVVAGAVTSLEVSFGSNLAATVQNIINQEVQQGNITVEVDLSFDAAPDVDPMDNTFNVVEYSASTNYEEAIRALRYANQSKYVTKVGNTRLGALTRDYVQEAIDTLDQDLYDIIYGNITIDLNGGTTVDGETIDTYVSNTVENDITLLTNIFNTTYFDDAVTNILNGGGANGGVLATDVAVDPTNLGAPADYADVQVSIESLYAKVGAVEGDVAQNTSDIAALRVDVDANTSDITTNIGNIAGNTGAIAGNTGDITTNAANIAGNTTNIAANTLNIAGNTTNIAGNTTAITNVAGDITAIQTTIANQTAADVSFDNAAHPAFDNNNNTADVQVALEDLHEQSTRLNEALNAIAAGGGLCEDNTTACVDNTACAGILGGTCVFAVADAANVIYDNATYPSVDLALDFLFTSVVTATAMIGNGNYYNDGDDVRLAVETIDGVLFSLGFDVDQAELDIIDLDSRLTTLALQVQANSDAIGVNTNTIAVNAGEIANNAGLIATNFANIGTNTLAIAANTVVIGENSVLAAANAADIAANFTAQQAAIDANTADIGTNIVDIAANTDGVTDLDNRVTVLEDFNNNTLETTIQNLIDASIDDLVTNRIVDIENRLAVVEDNQNNFAAYAFILGVSAQQQTGKFEFGGETGVRAATAMCQATYTADANAHLCTVAETQQAISLGNFDNGANFDNVFTWTQTGLSRRHNTIDAFTGASSRLTSCLDFLYESGDQASGTQMRVQLDEVSFGGGGGVAGDMIDIRPNVGCDTSLPVLCCR